MSSELSPAAKLRIALDMMEMGLQIMRQNLHRSHPNDTGAQIDERLAAWLQERPPDCPGTHLDISRFQ